MDELLPKMKTWKFNQFINILGQYGFKLETERKKGRIYKGVVGGITRLVSVHFHRGSDDIKPGTLAAMIRQSGLPKRLFR